MWISESSQAGEPEVVAEGGMPHAVWSLNTTIADLGARRQTNKKTSKPHSHLVVSSTMLKVLRAPSHCTVFTRLYRILVGAVIVIFAFFVISSMSFSNRLDEDFGADTWKTRWVLLDGWLSVLYLVVFFSIAFLWRPTSENRRLALSDELPTDELDADQYDVDAMETGRDDDDDEEGDKVPLRSVRTHGGIRGRDEQVVFDVGSDGEDDDGAQSDRGRKSGDSGKGAGTGERQRLRMEDSDEEGDITNLATRPPPGYSDDKRYD